MSFLGRTDSDWQTISSEYRKRIAAGRIFSMWRTGANNWVLEIRDHWNTDEVAPTTQHADLTWRQAMEVTEAIIALEDK